MKSSNPHRGNIFQQLLIEDYLCPTTLSAKANTIKLQLYLDTHKYFSDMS